MNQDDFPVEIADKIVHMLHQVTERNVNFMGKGGVIIATMQPKRLGQVHEGARRIMSGEVDEVAISMEDARKMDGTLPGYNGAVLCSGRRLGCIGLTGDPREMRPLQKLAAIIVREEYEKFQSEKQKQKILNNVIGEIDEISAAIQQISAGSTDILHHSQNMENMTNHAEKSIQDINQIVKSVKKIADETTLLGFNASIEAVRAGKYGGGFSVIAQEIGRLSSDSNSSLQSINSIMDEIRSSVMKIAGKVHENTRVIQQQSSAIESVNQSILGIKSETDRLTGIADYSVNTAISV